MYMTKKDVTGKHVLVDDMFLTPDVPTTAGSKMLEGYQSLLLSEALRRLMEAGYEVAGKTKVGEFAIDLLGETSYFGAVYENGTLLCPTAAALLSSAADGALMMDVNGAPRRAAAMSALVALKPTYGTVSRFGTVPVACSGECVSVLSKTADGCLALYHAVAAHDEKDGTSLPDAMRVAGGEALQKKGRVALCTAMMAGADPAVQAAVAAAKEALVGAGYEVVETEGALLSHAGAAWNILMSAELCNNVSRYDGVKYGYRSPNYKTIDELYTASRTEAFGDLLKAAILYGSETLSDENYDKVYDKALRVRRVICQEFSKLFVTFDAVLMPAASVMCYTKDMVEADKYLPYAENFYTAPASISGLPAVACAGVQLLGPAYSEAVLLSLADVIKEAES